MLTNRTSALGVYSILIPKALVSLIADLSVESMNHDVTPIRGVIRWWCIAKEKKETKTSNCK